MSLLQELIVIDPKSATPIYLQITDAVAKHILEGRLRKGLRLPGSREMAELLGVNRMTAVAAYEELDAQGWIVKVARKGTFVAEKMPVLRPAFAKAPAAETGDVGMPGKPGFRFDDKKILPFYFPDFPPSGKLVINAGFPDPRLAPMEDLIRSLRGLSLKSFNKKYLMYGGAQGTLFLRETLAKFLNDTRGLSIGPENILICKGAQMGLFLTATILLGPGEHVITGTPGYVGANRTFQQAGATVHAVPVDGSGIDVDAIERICREVPVRMVYVIPHHHHPTLVTLTPERRLRLLALAAEYRFAILEDDYDYDFHYASTPILPMASQDRDGLVVYVGTLTKSLAPAIRYGFMVAPVEFIRAATNLRKSVDTQGDSLIEVAIAQLYEDGTIERRVKKSVKLCKERRDSWCGLLASLPAGEVEFSVPEGGMSVWTRFLKRPLTEVAKIAYQKGLVMSDGSDYDTAEVKYNAVGLGFASLNQKEQEKAAGILGEVLRKMG
jgi:GntR family transcriptional regulator / MocR family aminotransferase